MVLEGGIRRIVSPTSDPAPRAAPALQPRILACNLSPVEANVASSGW